MRHGNDGDTETGRDDILILVRPFDRPASCRGQIAHAIEERRQLLRLASHPRAVQLPRVVSTRGVKDAAIPGLEADVDGGGALPFGINDTGGQSEVGSVVIVAGRNEDRVDPLVLTHGRYAVGQTRELRRRHVRPEKENPTRASHLLRGSCCRFVIIRRQWSPERRRTMPNGRGDGQDGGRSARLCRLPSGILDRRRCGGRG
mmetsp:Transcript_17220/g.49377  ORF Transcript_17220/g.49377 Transcript_17220/m.49377 type:complete len:202 (-) Transcript_17220:105-710(-)